MAKSVFVDSPPTEQIGDLLMIGVPAPTYKAISDLASKRGLTFGQFLGKAIDEYIQKTEQAGPEAPRPRLLVE